MTYGEYLNYCKEKYAKVIGNINFLAKWNCDIKDAFQLILDEGEDALVDYRGIFANTPYKTYDYYHVQREDNSDRGLEVEDY